MPKSFAAATLLVNAAKCRLTPSSPCPPSASNQRLAECALVMVSVVVKVLEATRNSVLCGFSRASTPASSCPSMFETK